MWAIWERISRLEDEPEVDGRPIVCVDFDGVLHSFTSGWCGITEIPDAPVLGAIEWLQRLVAYGGISVCVHGYRSRTRAGREAMRTWLLSNGMSAEQIGLIHWPEHKPAATVTIDDRSYRYNGDYWPSPQWLGAFKPWWERPPAKEQQSRVPALSDVADCGRCGGPPEIGWYDGGDRRNRYRAHVFCRDCGQSCADVTPEAAKKRWNREQSKVVMELA